MKKLVLVLTLAAFALTGAASAQDPNYFDNIGIYADQEGAESCANLAVGDFMFVYVVLTKLTTPAITGWEAKITYDNMEQSTTTIYGDAVNAGTRPFEYIVGLATPMPAAGGAVSVARLGVEFIEFVHDDKKAIVDQREVGSDTGTFANALRSSLRQDPDVVLIGEMRDFETIETALTAAETGHLVMSTLHTIDAKETVTRVISTFPPYHQRQVRMQLAGVIKGVISQRLVPKADGVGRVPAVEILVSTARVRECVIEKEKTAELQDAIAKGYTSYGMQTFDQSLMTLLKKNLITYDEAMRQSTSPDDFALRVKGILATGDTPWDDFEKVSEGEEEGESGKRSDSKRALPERF